MLCHFIFFSTSPSTCDLVALCMFYSARLIFEMVCFVLSWIFTCITLLTVCMCCCMDWFCVSSLMPLLILMIRSKWSKLFDERLLHILSLLTTGWSNSLHASRYWWLNDPFCSVCHSRDSRCFSLGRTNPKICPFRVGSRFK